jgi:hypothetical protein
MPNQPSGQVAAPTRGTARVRFKFAGRAHRREFTPNLEIKRKENIVKEKEEDCERKTPETGRREEIQRGNAEEVSPRIGCAMTGHGPGGPRCLQEVSIRSELSAIPALQAGGRQLSDGDDSEKVPSCWRKITSSWERACRPGVCCGGDNRLGREPDSF